MGDVGRGGGRVETGRGSGRETDVVRGRKTTSPGAWVGGWGVMSGVVCGTSGAVDARWRRGNLRVGIGGDGAEISLAIGI